jgi:hypothetical protein
MDLVKGTITDAQKAETAVVDDAAAKASGLETQTFTDLEKLIDHAVEGLEKLVIGRKITVTITVE